jgi:putative restriction endonuclease
VIDLARIRTKALQYVDRLSEHGDLPITWSHLNSFVDQGIRIPLVGQQGIFKPAALDLPISIRTTFRHPGEARPYEDEVDENGYLLYRYRGTDVDHYQNKWLRQAMSEAVPLLYLLGVASGLYLVRGAVIIEDHPQNLAFGVYLLDIDAVVVGEVSPMALDVEARRHVMAEVRRRAGQMVFRQSVLSAYRNQCTLCRLGHPELLDAAHIIPDAEGGPSIVPNGLSMCKIHHAAYDAQIIGVRPDHVAEVRPDVLAEIDGPMLRHGLQELHGVTIHLPRSPQHRPHREALEKRYERFRAS